MDGQQQHLPFLQSFSDLQQFNSSGLLSKPLQRKLDTLLRCNVNDAVSPLTVMQLTLSVALRAVNELTHYYQVEQHSGINIWAAVRSHGCQFLGPAMQEDVLKLILLALEDGSCLSRKVLVLFVVQRLQLNYPQASKTAVGHVVQLLYRASCFHVMKRDEESSLMQLKEEFRNYESLRCQHDAQIVEISLEFGLRILPEQWSCLLYGDSSHKPHMQSIVDKLSKKPTFTRSTDNLLTVLKNSLNPPEFLTQLKPHLNLLNSFHQSSASTGPTSVSSDDVDSCLNIVVHLLTLLASLLQQRPAHRCGSILASRYTLSRRCKDKVNQTKGCHEIDSDLSQQSFAENSFQLSCDANNRKTMGQNSIWSLSGLSSRADGNTEQRSLYSTGTCNRAVTANTQDDGRSCPPPPVAAVACSLSSGPSDFSMFQQGNLLFPPSCSFPRVLYPPQQHFITLPVSTGKVYTPIPSGNFCQLSVSGVNSSGCLQPLCFPDDFGLSMHL